MPRHAGASAYGLSPPVRGSLWPRMSASSCPGSIPARAGEPSGAAPGWPERGVYPRPCGGAGSTLDIDLGEYGLSPPVRGSPILCAVNDLANRSIPARAGEPLWMDCPSASRTVYPRPCGGASSISLIVSSLRGLSPPVRGSLVSTLCETGMSGSIPARAGEPIPAPRRTSARPVYPRPCGGARGERLRQTSA